MHALKRLCLTIYQMAKQALKQRRRQTDVDEMELERLDRIRNPSKY